MFDPGLRNFLLGITVILFLALVASSVLYRVYRTKPLLKPDFPDSRFAATWCSGQSDRSVLARLVGAKDFLWIIVTKDHLHVSPHFPFNLMFFAEVFGWDHRVPGKAMIEVRETPHASQEPGVLIRYRHATGDEELLKLQVSNVRGLMKALTDIRSQ
jgi:hypothetical protein